MFRMYTLELVRAEGKIIGKCEINHNLIVSRPKASLDKVLDEILQVARLMDEPVYDEPVFEVVWIENEEEVNDKTDQPLTFICPFADCIDSDHHQDCLKVNIPISRLIQSGDN